MKYIVGFSKYGLDLDVSSNPTKEELLDAFLRALGGPQNAFNNILNNLHFIKDFIKEGKIIK